MLVRRYWLARRKCRVRNKKEVVVEIEGWFLFGFIPIFIQDHGYVT